MSNVIFDAEGHATTSGYVRVYHFEANGEYCGLSDEYISTGTGLPRNSTIIAPEEPVTGVVSLFNGIMWDQKTDHRGVTVYSIDDRHGVIIDYIGPIKDGFVDVAPLTPFDKWDGASWVEDVATKRAAEIDSAVLRRSVLRAAADNEIDWLQDAVDGGIATSEEGTLLAAWKTYRVLLMRVDTSKAPDIVWPETPSS